MAARRLKKIKPEKRKPGRPPREEGPHKKNFSGYFEPVLMEELKSLAKQENRSLTSQVEFMLKDWLRSARDTLKEK